MIKTTDIKGTERYLNSDQIEKIELIPDTLIVLMNGAKYLIRESPDEVIGRITTFRRSVACGPTSPASGQTATDAAGREPCGQDENAQ